MENFNIYHIICIVLFGLTGTLVSLVLKWVTLQHSVGALNEYHQFSHPMLLNWIMFLGEMCCAFIYFGFYYYYKSKGEGKEETNIMTQGSRNFNPIIMLPPCILDLISSGCYIVSVHLTYISSLLMFKGSQVVFTGLFSAAFMNRRFNASELVGMALVIIGLLIIGTVDIYFTKYEETTTSAFYAAMGELLMLLSCAISSILTVYEEKFYFVNNDVPVLLTVGIEGLFGLILMTVLNIGFYFWEVGPVYGQNPRHLMEDCVDAVIQISNNIGIMAGLTGHFLLSLLYNYFYMAIIKELSALTSQVLDNIKIITVWIISVAVLDESFIWPKVPGFLILTYGMFLYNRISMMGVGKK